MTRRHFEAFARQIREHDWMTTPQKREAAQVVIRVASEFNPRFDPKRFLEACGL